LKSRKINLYDDKNPFGLVLVASLIDKGPNLGGLCRTSEIFNVKEFVIANMRFVEDKQFQSLAVTAEKWLNIKEAS
jgi:tRNA guanosine-2'-O-methyltransferase